MENLSPTWITEGSQDFEYKKYILLAYLQKCKSHFKTHKLYPPLSELISHFRNMENLKLNLDQLDAKFPKELAGLDPQNKMLYYTKSLDSDAATEVVKEIIEFALPTIQETIHEGKDIYDWIEQQIEITPVGLLPIYRNEGFLLINQSCTHSIQIYQFKYSVITSVASNEHALSMNYLYQETRSLSNTIEQIKLNLFNRFRELPNPATYFCFSKWPMPVNETLLPVAKRIFLRNLAQA